MNNSVWKALLLFLLLVNIWVWFISFKSHMDKNLTINNLTNDVNSLMKLSSEAKLNCIDGDDGFSEASYYADLKDMKNLTKEQILDKYSCFIWQNRITYKEMKAEIKKIEEQINQRYLLDFLYNNYWYIQSTDWTKWELQSDENFTYFDLSLIDIKKYPFIEKLKNEKDKYEDKNWKKWELAFLDITDFNIQCKEVWYKKDLKSRIQNGVSWCKLIEFVNGYEINGYEKDIKLFEENLNNDILKFK